MSDIFLSYDSRDLDRIKPLSAALSAQGWTVFYDRTIPPGKTWRQVIDKEINECRCMVVVWSKYSIDSNWVLEEADDGLNNRKVLVPVFIDQVKPPRGFRSIQAANLVNWEGSHNMPGFSALCGAVNELIGSDTIMSLTPEIHKQHNQTFVEPEMAIIPAGSFQMGSNKFDSETPIHPVVFANSFKLGKYPVTFAEYDVFAEETGREEPSDEGWGRDRRPVINVSWQNAVDYAAWLSDISGKSYRLPSEAEWEYACRAGSTGDFFWGYEKPSAQEYAWFDENAGGKTQSVGQKKANPLGLYDITGNVWEWLQDVYHLSYFGAPPNDGSAWEIGGSSSLRTIRGGSWRDDLFSVRSSSRTWGETDSPLNNIGFRLAQD